MGNTYPTVRYCTPCRFFAAGSGFLNPVTTLLYQGCLRCTGMFKYLTQCSSVQVPVLKNPAVVNTGTVRFEITDHAVMNDVLLGNEQALSNTGTHALFYSCCFVSYRYCSNRYVGMLGCVAHGSFSGTSKIHVDIVTFCSP